MGAVIRNYEPRDFERVRAIHEASGIDYKFPDLSSPLFLVTKVLELDGEVRACAAGYIQLEAYLFIDHSDWATPAEKLDAIRALDWAAMQEAWIRGIDCCALWLPPGMERFGDRLVELGWNKDRAGWMTFSKQTCSTLPSLS